VTAASVKIKFCHHYLRAFSTPTYSQKEIAMGILAINHHFNMRADGKRKLFSLKPVTAISLNIVESNKYYAV